MSSLSTLGESWIKAMFDDAIAETICSSTAGRQSDLHTDGLSLGLQGSILLSTLLRSPYHIKCIHKYFSFLTIGMTNDHIQVWHWHPHWPTGDFSMERPHLWTQTLVLLPNWYSKGQNDCFILNFTQKIWILCDLYLVAGLDHCEKRWRRETGEATHSKQFTPVQSKTKTECSCLVFNSTEILFCDRGMRQSLGSLSSTQEPRGLIGQLGGYDLMYDVKLDQIPPT